MKKNLPLILISVAILFLAYKTLYNPKEVTNEMPLTAEERIKIEKAQLENRQIEEMMGIETPQEKSVKIPTH